MTKGLKTKAKDWRDMDSINRASAAQAKRSSQKLTLSKLIKNHKARSVDLASSAITLTKVKKSLLNLIKAHLIFLSCSILAPLLWSNISRLRVLTNTKLTMIRLKTKSQYCMRFNWKKESTSSKMTCLKILKQFSKMKLILLMSKFSLSIDDMELYWNFII